jgi:hypothetical protein
MEVGVTPGALLEDAALAVPTGINNPRVAVAAPVSTVPATDRRLQLAFIAPPVVG